MRNGNGAPSKRTTVTDGQSELKRESSLVDEQYAKYMESGEPTTSAVDIEDASSDNGTHRMRVASLPAILEERGKGNNWTRM